MYYDEAVETAIKEEFLSKDNISETLHKNFDLEKLLQDVSKTYQETLQSASERIEMLQNVYQKELESRDKRIEQLQTEISQLRADIGQLRADLSAASQHNDEISSKLIQLTDQAQKLQLMQMQPPILPVLGEEPPEKKQGFWKRIFNTIPLLSYRQYPCSSRNAFDSRFCQIFNSKAKPVYHIIKRIETFIMKTLFTNLFPNLLNRV